MRYLKPSLTFEQQADLLAKRGLIADKNELVEKLRAVNYYRLSAYWYPFRQPDDQDPTHRKDELKPGTTFKMVWGRYAFDRQLRLLVMDAVERIEVAVRTRVAELHAAKYGPFGYLDAASFTPLKARTGKWAQFKMFFKRQFRPLVPHAVANAKYYLDYHDNFLERVRRATEESKETFVRHYFEKYTQEKDLPVWMVVEIMSMGNMLSMFQRLKSDDKRRLASIFNLIPPVFESWLLTLNYVRNLCAHHSRLWNRTLAIRPLIPKKKHLPEWHEPFSFENEKVFAVLTLLRFMLNRIAPQSHWSERLDALFQKHTDIPLNEMGFPDRWRECRIWDK